MPVFMVSSPDGKKYRVNAPEGATQQDAIARVQAQLGTPTPTPQAPVPDQMSNTDIAVDNAIQGATFGFGDEIIAGIGGALSPDLSYGDIKGQAEQELQQGMEQNPLLALGSQLATGLATGGAFGGTKAGSALANYVGSGNVPARIAKGFGAGALSGSLYGAGTAEQGETAQGAGQGAILGGLVGGAIPAVGSALSQLAKPLNPAISEGKQQVAKLAQKYGIPIGLDDLSDSKFYKTLISEGENIPFSGSADKYAKQQDAFTKAAAKSIGVEGDSLTPEVMGEAYKAIGKQFDDLTKGKTFGYNDHVKAQIDEIKEIADAGGFGATGAAQFQKYIADLTEGMKENVISGEALSKLRSKLNRIGRNAADENAKGLANSLEGAISDFITDGAPEALKKAKYQYKNFLSLEPLAQKAQVEGKINPSLLADRVRQIYKRDFTLGKAGELGDLARVGQLIKPQIPNSGTSQRTMARNLLTGGISGGVGTYLAVNDPQAAVPAIGLTALGLLANRGLRYRNYNPQTIQKSLIGMKPVTKKLNNVAGSLSNLYNSARE